jgi:predicted lipoprotein with Yx(FWY)xxD motif
MASAPAKTENGVLVGSSNDMTLYTFDKDPAGQGKSNCNDGCAKNWPPLMASAGDSSHGGWTVITRDDGSKQWAHDGKPLYFWAKDQKPGDMTGDNFRNVWHVARP